MAVYRAYFFDEHDHARHAIDWVGDSDAEAIAEVAGWPHGYAAVELWRGEQLVRRLETELAA